MCYKSPGGRGREKRRPSTRREGMATAHSSVFSRPSSSAAATTAFFMDRVILPTAPRGRPPLTGASPGFQLPRVAARLASCIGATTTGVAGSGGLEYDYLDFGNKPEDFSGTIINNGGGCCAFVGPFTFNTNNTQQISQLKFGLNYKLPPGFLFF